MYIRILRRSARVTAIVTVSSNYIIHGTNSKYNIIVMLALASFPYYKYYKL